jgi:hypothetical protein
MRVTNGRASGDGHDPNKIAKQSDACPFTIAHCAFLWQQIFAPNGANPCDNLHLELRLFDTAQQHRTDCNENGAAKGTTVLGKTFW